MTVEDLLAHIRLMPIKARKQLITMIVDTLAEDESMSIPKHNILEFEGIGAEMWQGVAVQSYLDELRNEWDSE